MNEGGGECTAIGPSRGFAARQVTTVSSNSKLAVSGHQPRARPRGSHDEKATDWYYREDAGIVQHAVSTCLSKRRCM